MGGWCCVASESARKVGTGAEIISPADFCTSSHLPRTFRGGEKVGTDAHFLEAGAASGKSRGEGEWRLRSRPPAAGGPEGFSHSLVDTVRSLKRYKNKKVYFCIGVTIGVLVRGLVTCLPNHRGCHIDTCRAPSGATRSTHSYGGPSHSPRSPPPPFLRPSLPPSLPGPIHLVQGLKRRNEKYTLLW